MTSRPLTLVVDDEPDIRELLTLTLARMDVASKAAPDLAAAKKLLAEDKFDLCLTDMRLPDGDGIELVRFIQNHYADIPVAVITAFGNVEGAVNTLKAGAFDYVSKPVDLQLLKGLVRKALSLSATEAQIETETEPQLLGASEAIIALRQQITKVARSQAPVFIHGQSGTGKELVARLIHARGPRANQPFVPINCGAIPTELVESEFFGHCKGSFTGATQDKKGLFQAADGGTLFLDEVAELPESMQVKLLRAIQEKAIKPVGAQHELAVDVRILSASHRDLSQLIAEGRFRQDLFYRINVIELTVPTLAERRDDIILLAKAIVQRLAKQQSSKSPPDLHQSAQQALINYDYPGNVRELENILERAMALCEGDVIEKSDINLPSSPRPVRAPEVSAHKESLDQQLFEQEKQLILDALEANRWHKTLTAKALGITFRALRYRLKKYRIE